MVHYAHYNYLSARLSLTHSLEDSGRREKEGRKEGTERKQIGRGHRRRRGGDKRGRRTGTRDYGREGERESN